MRTRTTGFVDTVPSQAGNVAIEEVVGPICGLWLACYTVETEQGFFAYAKLCARKPRSVWEAKPMRKMASGPFESPEAAITAVVDFATVTLSKKRERDLGLRHSWSNTVPGE